jgi:hypothetical protein
VSNNSQIAFAPQGATVLVLADATAPTGLQVPVNSRYTAQETGQVRMVNAGVNTIYVGVGATAAAAQANAAAGLNLINHGDTAAVIALVPGAVEILRFSPGAYFSGFAMASTALYITPGQGL